MVNYYTVDPTYSSEINKIPLLTRKEEQDIARKIAGANGTREQYRNKLITSNLKLVLNIARKHNWKKCDIMDLIQEGNIGLMKAVENYDYRRGVKFSTYATTWIKSQIIRYIKERITTVYIPERLFNEKTKINCFKTQMQQELERKPTTKEIADKMDISVARIEWVLNIFREPNDIFKLYAYEHDEETREFIDKKAEAPKEIADKFQLKEDVNKSCEYLKDREREVLILRHGLAGGKPFTLHEIGQIFKRSAEMARLVQVKAERKLRKSKTLESYVV